MADTGAEKLVGRDRHLRELRMLVDGVVTGHGYAVLLSGEPGAGKTTLAEEAAGLAETAGAHVAWVTCWRSAAAPLSIWIDLVAVATGEGADLAAPDATADPENARAARVRTLARQLIAGLEDRPILIVIDDLQWADPLSIHAIESLAGSLRDRHVGLVCTARDDGADPVAVPLGRLEARCRHLVVPPLTERELAALAFELTGATLSQSSLAVLHDRTAGNVLFARELLVHPDNRRHPGTTSSAAATVAIFSERFATLSAGCQHVVQTASVIGRRFRLDVLAEALNLNIEALLEHIGEAEAAGLVRDSGVTGFEFGHPLMAEACYQAGGLPRRVRLHRDVAEAMERLRESGAAIPAAEIAHHFANAAASGVASKAAHYAAVAGWEDMQQLAYEDAVRDFGLALRARGLCELDEHVDAELLIALGDAHAATGNRTAAREVYERAANAARHHGWADLLARAALGVGSGPGGFEVPPFDRDQITLLEEAAATVTGPLRPLVLARLSVARALDAGSTQRRLALSKEALRVARDTDDAAAIGYALASWCDVIPGPEAVVERLSAADEIVRCGEATGDARLELLGRRLRIVALLEEGRVDELDAEVVAFAARAELIGQPVYSWYVPLWQAMRASMEGRLEVAERLRRSAATIGEAASSENAELLVVSQWAMLHCELRTGAEPVAFFTEIVDRFPDYASMARPGIAYALAAAGDVPAARDVIATLDPSSYTVDTLGSELLTTLVMAAHAGWLAGDDRHAHALYGALLPHRSLFAVDGIAGYFVGSIERTLGVLAGQLGDLDQARSHFDAALRAHHSVRSPLLVAGTLRDAATCLGDAELAARADSAYASLGIPTGRPKPLAAAAGRPATFEFRRDGDGWRVGSSGDTAHLRHTKGMTDLARLIAEPHTEFHVLDLIDAGPRLVEGSIGDAIDATARAHYRARLQELEADLEAADRNGDIGRSERLHTERDALVAELTAAYGLGGRSRRRGESSERARSAVTQRIRDAITRIEQAHPAVARHLRRSIRTGTFCAYEPEVPINWEL